MHVQVLLKMNTRLFETCRRHDKYIETLMKKCAFFWSIFCITYRRSNCSWRLLPAPLQDCFSLVDPFIGHISKYALRVEDKHIVTETPDKLTLLCLFRCNRKAIVTLENRTPF
jgi:hypothetical protein